MAILYINTTLIEEENAAITLLDMALLRGYGVKRIISEKNILPGFTRNELGHCSEILYHVFQ